MNLTDLINVAEAGGLDLSKDRVVIKGRAFGPATAYYSVTAIVVEEHDGRKYLVLKVVDQFFLNYQESRQK